MGTKVTIYLKVEKNLWVELIPSAKYGWWTGKKVSPLVYTHGTHVKLSKEEAQVQIVLGLLPEKYFDFRGRLDLPIDLETMDMWVEK